MLTVTGSKDDWTIWLKNLRWQLLKESSYGALRACGSLAKLHEPLARSDGMEASCAVTP